MTAKLTLSIDRQTIKSAKRYATQKGRSLSDVVESYLKTLSGKEISDNDNHSHKIKKLRGSINVPSDFDYKKELQLRVAKK